jgi:hypothetical protein
MCSSFTNTIIGALSEFPDSGFKVKMCVLNMLLNSWIHIISLWINICNTVLLRVACILLLLLSSCLVILIYVTAWYHSGKFWKLGPKNCYIVLLFVHCMRSWKKRKCVGLLWYWEGVGGGEDKSLGCLVTWRERYIMSYCIKFRI